MGLCKCPKKKVTNLFCFDHRVNVCEHCLVANHSKCVVQSYLRWLQDSDYNPVCVLCNNLLTEESRGDCIRLLCYDVFHQACLNAYCKQLPANTAPAGYQCPACKTGVFPAENVVSPVAAALREILASVNWARAGLGLALIEELADVSTSSVGSTETDFSSSGYMVNGRDAEQPSTGTDASGTSTGSTAFLTDAAAAGNPPSSTVLPMGTTMPNTDTTMPHTGSTVIPMPDRWQTGDVNGHGFPPHPSANDRVEVSSAVQYHSVDQQQHNHHHHHQQQPHPEDGQSHPPHHVMPMYTRTGISENTTSHLVDTRKMYDSTRDEVWNKSSAFDHDEDKYKRRPAFHWFATWFKSRQTNKARGPKSMYKRFLVIVVIGLIGFITVVMIFSKYGRESADRDPFLDPMANPHIRVKQD